MGIAVPTQCDGYPLTPFLRGERPAAWRDAAYYEWDWRDVFIPHGEHEWPWDRRLERQNLAVRRSRDRAFVHFGDGSWRCFDLAADPTWQTEVSDPEIVLAEVGGDAELAIAQPRSHHDRDAAAGRRHRSLAA